MGAQHGFVPATGDGEVAGASPIVTFLRQLNDAADVESVADVVALGLLAPWRPDQLAVYLAAPGGAGLVSVTTFGYSADQAALYARVPLSVRAPLTEVYRTGEECTWAMDEAAVAFPAVAGWVREHHSADTAEVFVSPIRAGVTVIGVLLVTFPEGLDRSWRLRSRLEAAVSALGLWATGLLSTPARSSTRHPDGRGVQLSARQQNMLSLVEARRTNAQIAAALGVSVGTVKSDLTRLFRVLAVSDREQLPAAARQAGLMQPS